MHLRPLTVHSADGAIQGGGNFPMPDFCPQCGARITPRPLAAIGVDLINGMVAHKYKVQAAFACPRHDCQSVFVAYYEPEADQAVLKRTAPVNPPAPPIPDTVAKLSPNFVEIYTQATRAEAYGLDEITGIGLRKALEFLVKDYLISEKSADAQAVAEIKKKMLRACIKDYVTDPNVSACAARAAWLGNDEAHYERRWTTKDIEDLKRLVRLTMNWVDSAIETKRYVAEMPPPP